MITSQELVHAEMNYRLERARNAAVVREARKARRRQRSSLMRRWLTRVERPRVRRVTPALP
jgi:hypothetical protein